jgi:transposase
MFTDTLKANVTSWFQQNRYAQVFATRFGWVRVFPMQKKSQAHEALSLLVQRDGVPPVMIMDGAKEQTMGEFRRKAREMGMRIKQTEPYSPWQNAAEGAIREVKRGAVRKMTKANSPSTLWDHCLELEGYIRSSTALDIYELHGQVPETILSGQTADISPFVQHGWYDWVKWYDSQSSFPEPREHLG